MSVRASEMLNKGKDKEMSEQGRGRANKSKDNNEDT